MIDLKTFQRADRYALGVFLFSACYLFFNLGGGSLYPWDEGWYSVVAREIVVEGKGWLTLHYNGEPWFHKPPLYPWMIAVAYKLFGVNEFAVRVWSTLFGLGTVILLYSFAKSLFQSRRIALFSSLLLVGFSQFVKQSRMGMLDAPLTFFILLGLYFFWMGRKRQTYLLFVGICTGLGFMLKSFGAFLLPITILLYSILTGELRRLAAPQLVLGFLLGLLLCLPWHLYEYSVFGASFLNDYFLYNVFERTLHPLQGNQGNVLYYVNLLILKNIPWGVFALATLPYLLAKSRQEKDRETRAAHVLVSSAIIVVLLIFSFAGTKLPWYIVPVYPFMALAIAVSVDSIIARVQLDEPKVVAIVLMVMLLVPVMRFAFDKKHRNPDYAAGAKSISLLVKSVSSDAEPLLLYDVDEEPLVLFYSERRIQKLSREELLSMASRSAPFVCLMGKRDGLYRQVGEKTYSLVMIGETKGYVVYKKS